MTAVHSGELLKKPRYGTPQYQTYLRLRRCGEKVPYSAKWVAENAAVALTWKSAYYEGMCAYLCEFCDHWHLGHEYFREGNEEMSFGTRRALEKLMFMEKENDQ